MIKKLTSNWPFLLLGLGAMVGITLGWTIFTSQPTEARIQPFNESTNPYVLQLAPFSLASLKAELDNDPQGYEYALLSNFQAAQALNLFRVNEVVTRENISVQELQSQVVISEYILLTGVQREGWTAILVASSDGGVDVSNQAIRDQAAAIWGPLTSTRQNLIDIQTIPGSRAEALWGQGFSISAQDVEEARLLP